MSAVEEGSQTDEQTLSEARPLRWWHDRGLVILLVLFVLVAPLVTSRIYASDEIQYFAYTHSLFFDRDLDFGDEYLHFYDSDPVKFAQIKTDLYDKREPLTNLPINVAPIGTGLMWMPSYAVAHILTTAAKAIGFKVQNDGYSQPYIIAICYTSYIFGCLGLLLCYSLLKRFFAAWVAVLTVIAMWLATPLIFYTVVAPPWSHATSFLAVTLFIWYWYHTRGPRSRTWVQWALLGASGGLVMLVREQDVLFLAIPAVEALYSIFVQWRLRSDPEMEKLPAASVVTVQPGLLNQVGRWALGLVVMGVVAAVVFIPQLIAYRVITGRFAPSRVVSSKLNWLSPNFLNVLFSPEHGLIPWTPVVLLCLVGLVFLWQRDRLLSLALAVAFLLQVYVAGSFLTWQGAGSFGQRRFINCTLIFALGFAMLASWLAARGLPKWVPAVVAGVFVLWNGGLLMNYALWCSPQRQGLDWATLPRDQFEIAGKSLSLAWDYLTDRQRFYRRTREC